MNEKALELIESAYNRYLMKEINSATLCKNLAIALGALPFDDGKKEFTIQITNQKNNEKFFGMRVFPKSDELDEFCKDFVNENSEEIVKFSDIIKRWKSIDNWFIELDSMLFDRNIITFNPKELTAMTLHEIGHVIYSGKPVERFYRSYREAKLRMKTADKATQKLMYNIYMIPLSIACMQRQWVNSKNQVQLEMLADKTVVEYGYGDYLVEAFDKIIRKFGSINASEDAQQNEIDSQMQWCSNQISDIMMRKDKLKDELYYIGIKNKSNYLKAITIIVLNKLGFKMKERYTGAVVENSLELFNMPDVMSNYIPFVDVIESAKFDNRLKAMISAENIAMEALFNNRKKIKVELPSQYEIDAISVEVDKITNHHDRIFVLDMIYEVLEKINNFEEVISADPSLVKKWSGKINMMKDQLESLRQATLAKKTFTNKYKFFVSLPEEAKDYEG